MISIQQMQYILALSEEKQFGKASERCFVTQPTLSMQLKKAEEALGYQIFDRSRSPLELTMFGDELLPIIREILSENERIAMLVKKASGTMKEHFRIAIIPTISGYLIPELFATWQKELTDIRITIEEFKTEEAIEALEMKKIDLAILAGPVNNSKLRSSFLYEEEIKAYVPSEESKEISAEKLGAHHPWLLTKGNCLRTQMIHFCDLNQQAGDEWNYQGGSIALLQRMVDLYGGYTLVPANCYKIEERGYKTIRSETGEIPARSVIALTPNRTAKWKHAEQIIRSIQLKYHVKNKDGDFKILSWQ